MRAPQRSACSAFLRMWLSKERVEEEKDWRFARLVDKVLAAVHRPNPVVRRRPRQERLFCPAFTPTSGMPGDSVLGHHCVNYEGVGQTHVPEALGRAPGWADRCTKWGPGIK